MSLPLDASAASPSFGRGIAVAVDGDDSFNARLPVERLPTVALSDRGSSGRGSQVLPFDGALRFARSAVSSTVDRAGTVTPPMCTTRFWKSSTAP